MLQDEATSPDQRRQQRYVDEAEVVAPSVITLNAVPAAYATNDFMISMLGLHEALGDHDHVRFLPRTDEVWSDEPRRDPACIECGPEPYSRFARGDGARLPTRLRRLIRSRAW